MDIETADAIQKRNAVSGLHNTASERLADPHDFFEDIEPEEEYLRNRDAGLAIIALLDFICEPIVSVREGNGRCLRHDARRIVGRVLAVAYCVREGEAGESQTQVADSIGVSRVAFHLHVEEFRRRFKFKTSTAYEKRSRAKK